MKFQVCKDTVIETITDDMTLKDVINAKLNSMEGEGLDEAFLIGDLRDILHKIKSFKKFLPTVEPFYAVKCNNEPIVLSILASHGLGFDCASKGEIQTMINMGASPNRIIFANPCKQTSHIKYAASNNVAMMTFDNEYELHKIKAIYPEAQLVIRISVDDTKAIHKLSQKFGVPLGKTKPLLETAKRLHLNVIGASFHVGSGCYDSSAFYYAVKTARDVFTEGESIGYNFNFLDIGGGFPGDNSAAISFEETSDQLNRAFVKYFPPNSGVRIIAEPGRFFVSSAFTVVCNITSVRYVMSENSSEKTNQKEGFMYYINDGVYGTFNCIYLDAAQKPKPKVLEPLEGRNLYPSSIWGQTCAAVDCISKHWMLPELKAGDCMYFENMGAYSVVSSSEFNGFTKPRIHYVVGESHAPALRQMSENGCPVNENIQQMAQNGSNNNNSNNKAIQVQY